MGTGSVVSAVSVGSALIVSVDAATIALLKDGAQQFAISSDVCGDMATALQRLNGRKFEAIFVDHNLGEQAGEILERVRASPANGTAVTFLIAEGSASLAREAQPNFVMIRPLSAETVGQTLKAAYGLIVRERRRYFRCPVEVPADIWKNDVEQIACQATNVSEGGISVNTAVRLKPGALVGVEFKLPGHSKQIATESEICWYDEQSRAGLRFTSMSPGQQSVLNAWLTKKLEEILPESVTSKFRKAGYTRLR